MDRQKTDRRRDRYARRPGVEGLEGRQLMATMACPAVGEIVVTKDLDGASTNLMSPTTPDDGGDSTSSTSLRPAEFVIL